MKRVFRNPFRKDGWQEELDDELELHVELRVESLMRKGLSAREARAEAERRLGNLAPVRQEVRRLARRRAVREKGGGVMDEVMQNVRYGMRALLRRPLATGVVLLTLALGIGATTAVFSVANAVLWRPYPFADPNQVVAIYGQDNGWDVGFGPAMIQAWENDARSLAALTAFGWANPTLTGLSSPSRVTAWRVTHEFFDVLGVPLVAGRGFREEEDRFGAPPTAVLSQTAWTTYYDADPGVIGSTVEVNGQPVTVVGVAPASLEFSTELPELYVPLQLSAEAWGNAGGGWLTGIGRLATGASTADAQAELERMLVEAGLFTPAPGDAVVVQEIQARFTDPVRAPLVLLLGAVGLVLIIGCANIANLLLAQGTRRVREVAVRAALGASRVRVARQLMTENLLLGAAGAALGLVVAAVLVPVLVQIAPAELPRLGEARLDGMAVVFAGGMAVLTAVLFGAIPTIIAGRTDIRGALGDGGRGSRGRSGGRARALLVAGEVALSMVLLASSGLLLRSVVALGQVDRGFDESVVAARLALPWGSYPEAGDAIETFHLLLDGVRAQQGVGSAAMTSRAPFVGNGFGLPVTAAEEPWVEDESPGAALRIATAGLFQTMGMPLTAGREFEAGDDVMDGRTVVVNDALVAALGWSPEESLGRAITLHGSDFVDATGRPLVWEVVGVVGDAPGESLREAATPEAYFPSRAIPEAPWNWIGRELVLVVQPQGDLASLVPSLRRAIGEVDPALPVDDIGTLGERVAESVAVERIITMLVGMLGALALILSAGGIFGVVAYSVAARRPEIGLRMALGSSAHEAQRLMVGRALGPVVAGGVLGTVGVILLGRQLAPILFGVVPWDPAALAGAFMALLLTGAAAAWLPARQAAAVDPVEVLSAD